MASSTEHISSIIISYGKDAKDFSVNLYHDYFPAQFYVPSQKTSVDDMMELRLLLRFAYRASDSQDPLEWLKDAVTTNGDVRRAMEKRQNAGVEILLASDDKKASALLTPHPDSAAGKDVSGYRKDLRAHRQTGTLSEDLKSWITKIEVGGGQTSLTTVISDAFTGLFAKKEL